MAKRIGFGLLELILVAGLIAVLAGGGFYATQMAERQSAVEVGKSALEQAEELKQTLNKRAADQAKELENLRVITQPATSSTATSSNSFR